MRLPILAGTALVVVSSVAYQWSRSFLFPGVQIINFEKHLEVLSIKFTSSAKAYVLQIRLLAVHSYACQPHFSPWQTQVNRPESMTIDLRELRGPSKDISKERGPPHLVAVSHISKPTNLRYVCNFTRAIITYFKRVVFRMWHGFTRPQLNEHAVNRKTGTAKYPQKLPSSTAILGHNHTLFKISNWLKTFKSV